MKLVAHDLKIVLLSGMFWLAFVGLGGFSLAILVLPLALVCVVHVALLFSLLRVPGLMKGIFSAVAPIPGLMLQWRLLGKSEAIDGQSIIIVTWQFILLLSLLACIPAALAFVKSSVASRAR
jgi:hypothetical protein